VRGRPHINTAAGWTRRPHRRFVSTCLAPAYSSYAATSSYSSSSDSTRMQWYEMRLLAAAREPEHPSTQLQLSADPARTADSIQRCRKRIEAICADVVRIEVGRVRPRIAVLMRRPSFVRNMSHRCRKWSMNSTLNSVSSKIGQDHSSWTRRDNSSYVPRHRTKPYCFGHLCLT
jgi:hypothetical protein